MNITDDDIRNGLNNYADSIQTTPPPIGRLTRETDIPLSSRRRPARRPVLAGVAITGALLGAGVAAATGVFSTGTTEFVESVCGLNIDDARLVASDTDSLGNLVEFSVINGPTGDATSSARETHKARGHTTRLAAGPGPGAPRTPPGVPGSAHPTSPSTGRPHSSASTAGFPNPLPPPSSHSQMAPPPESMPDPRATSSA